MRAHRHGAALLIVAACGIATNESNTNVDAPHALIDASGSTDGALPIDSALPIGDAATVDIQILQGVDRAGAFSTRTDSR